MSKIDKRFLLVFVFTFLIFLLASFHYHNKTVMDESNMTYVDFRVYYYAGLRLQMGENIYNINDGYFIYKYSPIFALLMSSIRLSVITPPGGLRVWYLILFVSFILSLYLLKEILFCSNTCAEARSPTGIHFFDIIPLLFIFRYLILVNFVPSYFSQEWSIYIKVHDFFLLYILLPLYVLRLVFVPKKNGENNSVMIMVLTILFILRFLALNIDRAQVNIGILLLALFFSYYFIRKKDVMAGMYLGIAIIFKLTPVIFLVYLLAKKRLRAFSSAIATFAILLFIPSFRWGIKRNFELMTGWINALKVTLPSEYLQHKNQSLLAAISRFFSKNSDISMLKLDHIFLTGLIAFAYVAFMAILLYSAMKKSAYRENETVLYDLSLFFIAMIILSPVGTKATFVYTLLPVALLLKEAFKRNLKDRLLNAGLLTYVSLIYLNSGDIIGDFSIVAHKYSLMTFCLLIIFSLIIYIKYRASER